MDATEAQTFTQKSLANATIVALAARERGCNCEPYVDWFTYRRWQAQGFQVKRGEHGIKLMSFAPITEINEDGETVVVGKRPWASTVFCRCQVKPK